MDGSSFCDVSEQGCACCVQFSLLAKDRRFVKIGSLVCSPPTFAGGDDLVLHYRRGRTQIQKVNWALHEVSQRLTQIPQIDWINAPLDQYRKVKVTVGVGTACDPASKSVNGQRFCERIL
jgi:hypothetical protein